MLHIVNISQIFVDWKRVDDIKNAFHVWGDKRIWLHTSDVFTVGKQRQINKWRSPPNASNVRCLKNGIEKGEELICWQQKNVSGPVRLLRHNLKRQRELKSDFIDGWRQPLGRNFYCSWNMIIRSPREHAASFSLSNAWHLIKQQKTASATGGCNKERSDGSMWT